MLNICLPACTKVELWDLTVCIVVNGEKNLKSHSNLDLGLTMPNIEFVRDIFIYYNAFSFLSYRAKTRKHGNTHTHAHTHTDSDEYSIVAFCKNATIKTKPEASWYKISAKKAYTNSQRIFTLRTERRNEYIFSANTNFYVGFIRNNYDPRHVIFTT